MQQKEVLEKFSSSSFDLESYVDGELKEITEFDLRKKINQLKLIKSRINKGFNNFIELNHDELFSLQNEAIKLNQVKIKAKNHEIDKKFNIFESKNILSTSFFPSSVNYSLSTTNNLANLSFKNNSNKFSILSRRKEEALYEIEGNLFNCDIKSSLKLFIENDFHLVQNLEFERVKFVMNTVKKSVFQFFQEKELQVGRVAEDDDEREIILMLFKLPLDDEGKEESKILEDYLKSNKIIQNQNIRNSLKNNKNIVFGTENFTAEFTELIQFLAELVETIPESNKENFSFQIRSKVYSFVYEIMKYFAIHIKQSVDDDEEIKHEVLDIWNDFDNKKLIDFRDMLETFLE